MLNDFLDQILIFGMSTLGGPFSAASCSQHIFFFFLSRFIEKWKEGRGGGARGAGAVQTAGKGEEGGRKGKKMHLICSPSPRYVGFSRTGYVPSISLFSRTRLCTQSTEGCWLTANSNCPEAIGSHFQTGSFIFPWKRKWSLALILNHPPAAVYKVIREAP